MKQLGAVGWTAWILVIMGGLNWGLIGINSNFNLVDMIFGNGSLLSRIIYLLVGVATLIVIYYKVQHLKNRNKS
jgi:hypothetical protein